MFTLILLSGGAGTRMKYAVPKQYMLLAGKPVIMHILERLDSIQAISDIVVVCAPEYEGTITEMVSQYGIRKPIRYAPAGRTRQESVLSGLSLVTSPDVIIHEAARPFVKVEDFEEIIRCPDRNATFGLDIPFTVLRGQDHVEGVLTRSELFNVQLPQKFETSVLKEAHGKALAVGGVPTASERVDEAHGRWARAQVRHEHEHLALVAERLRDEGKRVLQLT